MTYNQPSQQSHEELVERATAAILREYAGWGVTEAEARDVVERNFVREQRLGPELAREHARPPERAA